MALLEQIEKMTPAEAGGVADEGHGCARLNAVEKIDSFLACLKALPGQAIPRQSDVQHEWQRLSKYTACFHLERIKDLLDHGEEMLA